MRFVTVNTFLTVFNELSWDIHGSKPFITVNQMKDEVAPMYDQAYSALIEDLHQRACSTTSSSRVSANSAAPQGESGGGRDHWPQCFTCTFAGGGVKGGQVVGKSDPVGGFPAERPSRPATSSRRCSMPSDSNLETHSPAPPAAPSPSSISARSGEGTVCVIVRMKPLFPVTPLARDRLRLRERAAHPPETIRLDGPEAIQHVLALRAEGENFVGEEPSATFSIAPAGVAEIIDGVIVAKGNGKAVLTAKAGDAVANPRDRRRTLRQTLRLSFNGHVMPVLTRQGCNMGACHGAVAGKGGFRLSLRGYDPPRDF